ncbi:DNA cytosine methyltransferase [Riemerella anatipestifer]|uniref:DNA cytosine methyltransferase n=1 Tax=Riemerella anatipestifer TaxID=34085 RepID=UPI0007ECB34A|nr:DNA cytosine methyltransferase [Riemerella anatipestifer]AZZ57624.1 DNA cytosine methyltransferase [Riemerella anatipestifer]MCW0511464.1 DNA cytosine methyltransferase [Riemerella anatipestifer]MCW0519948.1 DNA cytosine methyltransferase [Riemerella anatipestifer]MDY3315711.1 DNA cytosine methyltransferase [Riemerella anatipestifer]MDY3391196.1 DNA cytosine methyltransferase [Riemerella anatipestifer]
MKKKQYTIFETFVGAGGSHIGFKKNNFKSVYVNDNNIDCIKTLLLNNPEIEQTAFVDYNSIIDVNVDNLLNRIKLEKGELDVMFGGIVCKGFSLAGERSPNDERNYFYHKQLELVNEIKPKISIIENVKAFLNGKVLSEETPLEIRQQVDFVWQQLENYKGQKAELRKKNNITNEFLQKGVYLRKEKEKLLRVLKENHYLISVVEDIYKIYDKIGYNVTHKVLNTAWYGSSTKRERVIIVATRKDLPNNFNYPLPKYHSNEISTKMDFDNLESGITFLKPITIGEALNKIDYSDKKDKDNEPMKHSKKTVDRFKFINAGGNIQERMDELPDELKISNFYSRGNTMRLDMNSLAPTLVPGHSNFPVHPIEHRSITVREAAVITGFPLNYKFVGSHTKRCEHVGNAVPPPLAEAIAEECVKYLDKINNNNKTIV